MEQVQLTPQIRSSRIGFGCAGLLREPSPRLRRQVLESAFDHGIRHFDVARMYGLGAAEGELARFLRGRREEVVVATKFGIEPGRSVGRLARLQGPARELLARFPALRNQVKRRAGKLDRPHRYDVATAKRHLETSLRELRTDYVDILFLHGPSAEETFDAHALCEFLEDVRRAGHVRAWGLAGERADCSALARDLPDTTLLQVREDIFSRERADKDAPRAQITFGALSGTLETILDGGWQPPWRARQHESSAGMSRGERADALASLLLADALQARPDAVVLYSTTKPERLGTVDRAIAAVECEPETLSAQREELSTAPTSARVGR
jgi:aryl-alcohol dehydrogenase-like predicted oxidoreductase